MAQHEPAILDAVRRAVAEGERLGTHVRPSVQAFAGAPDEPIDYTVMKKLKRVAVVPVAMGLNDVGSWDAFHAIGAAEEAGNAIGGEVIALDTNNCLACSDGVHIATLGVNDLIVVASGNDVLVLPRGRSKDVKVLLEALRAQA